MTTQEKLWEWIQKGEWSVGTQMVSCHKRELKLCSKCVSRNGNNINMKIC